jgi:hypothetical protein
MTEPLEARTIDCPYCGEPFDLLIDFSAGSQAYVEDCQVCCRPVHIELVFDIAGDLAELRARRDDE